MLLPPSRKTGDQAPDQGKDRQGDEQEEIVLIRTEQEKEEEKNIEKDTAQSGQEDCFFPPPDVFRKTVTDQDVEAKIEKTQKGPYVDKIVVLSDGKQQKQSGQIEEQKAQHQPVPDL